jgi:hypothetical protein
MADAAQAASSLVLGVHFLSQSFERAFETRAKSRSQAYAVDPRVSAEIERLRLASFAALSDKSEITLKVQPTTS